MVFDTAYHSLSRRELGLIIDNKDWSESSLGERGSWSDNLNNFLRFTLTSINPVAILWGTDLILLYNDAFKELIAKKHPDSLGLPVYDVFPEIRKEIEPVFRQVFKTGTAAEIRQQKLFLFRSRRAEECFFDFYLNPITSDEGNVEGILFLPVEVTEQVLALRQLEEHSRALRVSEERFKTIVESATEYAIFTMDLDGRINSWNSGARRLFGWQSDEAVGRYGDIIFPDKEGGGGSEKASREIEIAFETGSATNERWHVRKDGSYFWASGMVMTMTNDTGDKITGFVKIIQDKTERKRREEQDKFLITLSDALRPLSDPVMIQVEASRILGHHLGIAQVGYAKVDADENWATTEGEYSDGSMQPFRGRRITLDSFGPRMLDSARRGKDIAVNDVLYDERTSTPGTLKTYSYLGVRSFVIIPLVKDGHLSAYLFATNPEPAEWDESDVHLMRETAERTWSSVQRARAESALRKSEMQLRSLNETLEERIEERTAALVAYKDKLRSLASELNKAEERERQNLAAELHDNLGQILAMSKMELDLLKRSAGSQEIVTGLDGLANLINEGIRYTRELMSDLKPPPALDKEDVGAAIDWVARIMKKHGLDVKIRDDGKPKPLSEEVRVIIVQSVKELLFNIVKHAGVREASIELARLGSRVRVAVIDRGSGYDPDDKDSKPGEDGGFGLFNIREQMDLLNGELQIISKRGEGTRVLLFAPVKNRYEFSSVKSKEAEPVEAFEPKNPGFSAAGKKIRVLLVDDHKMMREGLQEMIESQSDIVVISEATDGEEAILLARQNSPDVIVMDVDMPNKNGIDATREIRSENPDVRIIGLSLHENREVAEAMRKAGASAYLTKSEVFETLCETIREESARAKE